MTIQKNPDTKKETLPEQTRHKGKHTHKPTACVDKRRAYHTCGICGSENTASHGVSWCTQCEEEIHFFILDGGWFAQEKTPLPKCKCVPQQHPYQPYREHISVGVCLDCGAVRGPRCPVCKSKMWVKGNKKYCKGYCGYRDG